MNIVRCPICQALGARQYILHHLLKEHDGKGKDKIPPKAPRKQVLEIFTPTYTRSKKDDAKKDKALQSNKLPKILNLDKEFPIKDKYPQKERQSHQLPAGTMAAARGHDLKSITPRKSTKKILCVKCGELVLAGQLLAHKESVHKEYSRTARTALPHNKNRWVKVVSGGLPSLGKRKR